jgi:hypothetical protein
MLLQRARPCSARAHLEGRDRREDPEMMDAIFVIVVVVFFAAAITYVNACERS